MRSGLLLSSAALLIVAGMAAAETAPTLPPGFVLPHGQHDVRKATAGTYTSDVQHAAVIARVSHLGFSMSVFRFGKSAATLQWDPAHIEKSTLSASVDPASIDTPVPGFAKQLLGAEYLNTAKYPTATFVSTAFHAKDFAHGTVNGKLTIMGRTVNATFDVELVGAGPGFAAGPTMGHVIGIHAATHVDPKVLGLPAVFSDPIEIAVDTEFTKKG
ncbi:MAG TPA: YceI family protein [Rhizomicrobium sp.]|jgi:polyisoprenoid-binding protein YceI|nr:YceI family protein [Rhizomicrobium sp.]